MAASKNFLTFSQQVESLKNDKHIIIPDFMELHGISQAEYMNPNNYNNIPRNRKTIGGLIKKLYGAINTTEYEYVNHYRTQYNNIPLWVTTSVLTFGSL